MGLCFKLIVLVQHNNNNPVLFMGICVWFILKINFASLGNCMVLRKLVKYSRLARVIALHKKR